MPLSVLPGMILLAQRKEAQVDVQALPGLN